MKTVVSQGNESFRMKPICGPDYLNSITRMAVRFNGHEVQERVFNKVIDAWHC